jgi:ABC-type transport system substrate-binding protein
VQFDMRLDPNTCFEETKTSQLDIGCVPPDQVVAVAQQYGVSRTRPVGTGRFWVTSTGCELPLLFNHRKALLSGNRRLRQAVNWAVDRTAVAEASNPYAVTPWTHILPPGFPGAITARRLQPYSLRPDLAKARQLAAGHLGDGNIRVAYQSAGTIGPAMAVMVRQALIGLGFDPSRIYMQGFAGFNIYEAAGARGTPFDLVVGTYICSDSPDPVSLIGRALNVLGDFTAENAAYNRKLAALSSRPPGKARLRALGRFDLEVTKKLAPVAVVAASNDLTFFSNRVDPASLRYSPVSGWSFTALRLK